MSNECMSLPPEKEVVWRWDWGVYVPFCPYCDEPAYEQDKCVFCGRPYKWVDGEHQPTEVRKANYIAVQSTNNHITIYKDGRMKMHSACTEKKTEEELLKMIDNIIRFEESGAIEDLLKDEGDEDEQ